MEYKKQIVLSSHYFHEARGTSNHRGGFTLHSPRRDGYERQDERPIYSEYQPLMCNPTARFYYQQPHPKGRPCYQRPPMWNPRARFYYQQPYPIGRPCYQRPHFPPGSHQNSRDNEDTWIRISEKDISEMESVLDMLVRENEYLQNQVVSQHACISELSKPAREYRKPVEVQAVQIKGLNNEISSKVEKIQELKFQLQSVTNKMKKQKEQIE